MGESIIFLSNFIYTYHGRVHPSSVGRIMLSTVPFQHVTQATHHSIIPFALLTSGMFCTRSTGRSMPHHSIIPFIPLHMTRLPCQPGNTSKQNGPTYQRTLIRNAYAYDGLTHVPGQQPWTLPG
jgi:hypothetical protein